MTRLDTLALIGKDPAALMEAQDLQHKGCRACMRHVTRLGLVVCGEDRKRPRRVQDCRGFVLLERY